MTYHRESHGEAAVASPLDSLDFDLSSLEITDFLDESRLEDGETISNVMAASCTSCECCCSTS